MVVRAEDAERLIAEHIEPNPYKPGRDQARIAGVGVSVWAFISHLHAVGGSVAQAAEDYEVSREAAEAAVHYYRRHENLIDARIAVHDASFGPDV